MPRHTCHFPGCDTACPPRFLFCRNHWSMVPRDLQDEVYRTVRLRGPSADKTWAPWWRAQALATAAVARSLGIADEYFDRWLERAMATADKMELIGREGE